MQIAELSDYPAGTVHHCDVCIVGSGPAGLTIATELADGQRDVLVLESGARSREDPFSTALNEIESIGVTSPMEGRAAARNRVFGGSSLTWSGRCTWLDPIDFEARPWVSGSGWPVSDEELTPYVERSARYLGLIPQHQRESRREEALLQRRLHLSADADVQPVSWVFSQSARFASDYVRFGPAFAKLAPDKVRVLLHATVKNILTSEDASQVVALEIVTTEGEVHLVRSRQFVLCCGGIENARLLLAARDVNPRGLGNEHGLVGRFLMDHPRATLGTFASADMHAVQGYLGLFSVPSKARFQCGFRLSDEVQRNERLLNAAAWTTQHVAEDDVWRSLRSALIAPGPDRLAKIGAVCRNGSQLVTSLWDKFARGRPIRRKFSHLDLDCMVEQEPNRESCIRLSSRKDAFGVPLAQLDWKIGDLERQTVVRLGRAVHDALAKAGLPTPTLVDWVRDDRRCLHRRRAPRRLHPHGKQSAVGCRRSALSGLRHRKSPHRRQLRLSNLRPRKSHSRHCDTRCATC
jgi:choline dehydrogenase-like flavoprotein